MFKPTYLAFASLLAAVSCSHAASQSPAKPDPTVTDGDKYKVILENKQVRVLRYSDRPGEKTSLHHHPHFVIYALDGFKRRLTFADGKVMEREFKAGDIAFMPDQSHIGENIGP